MRSLSRSWTTLIRALLGALTVSALLVPLTGSSAGAVTSEAGEYNPLTPARILDTRTSVGGHPGPMGPGGQFAAQVAGQGGVPVVANVEAVVLNVTAVRPTAAGYLIVWPNGVVRPNVSTLNFTAGKTVPNLATIKIGADGKIAIYNSAGNTHVIFDVVGYYSSSVGPDASRWHPLDPVREFDTRNNTGGVGFSKVGPGGVLHFDVSGVNGVPANATAVVLNVTVTQGTASSFLTVYPDDVSRPTASNLNFSASQSVPNLVIVRIPASGIIDFYNSAGAVHVLADVMGYYDDVETTEAGRLVPLTPCRTFDSRPSQGGPGPLPAGFYGEIVMVGFCGVNDGESDSVVLNTTATNPTAAGFLTVTPDDVCSFPNASNLNFTTGLTVANAVQVRLSLDTACENDLGAVDFYNASSSASVNVIVDVFGYFTNSSATTFSVAGGVGSQESPPGWKVRHAKE